MSRIFTNQQRKILIGTVIAYTAAYLNRLNLSAALSGVMEAFSISASTAGLLQTAFASIYAAGQLVNGAIVDKISPVRHLLIGLIGSGLCNLFMGFSPSFGFFIAMCMLNGAFQSMLWTPIVRLFALCFHTEQQRGKANFIHSFALVIGHFCAWAISGFLIDTVGWQLSFIVPAMVMAPVVISVFIYLQPVQNIDANTTTHADKRGNEATVQAFYALAATGFFLILISSVLYGFVRDGIITWAPEILRKLTDDSALSATAFSLIIPAINAVGVWLGYCLIRRGDRNTRKMIAYMNFACVGFCMFLPASPNVLLAALLMGLSCASLFGLNPLLTTLVPLEYDKIGRTGLTAGLIDSFIYMGSALAGVIDGGIYEKSGLNALYLTWILSGLAGTIAVYLSGTRHSIQALNDISIRGRSAYENHSR